MRDFSWKYFTLTGDVDAFLLYKQMDQLGTADMSDDVDSEEVLPEGDGRLTR